MEQKGGGGDAGYVPLVYVPPFASVSFGAVPNRGDMGPTFTYFLPPPSMETVVRQQYPVLNGQITANNTKKYSEEEGGFRKQEEKDEEENTCDGYALHNPNNDKTDEQRRGGRTTSFRLHVLRILPERVIRRIFVVFGLVLCFILMIDGAGYLAFSDYAKDKIFINCFAPSTGATRFLVHISDESASLGFLAGGVGLASGLLFSLLFVFTLLVNALSKGRLQLCLALCIQLCCFCLMVLFLLSWAFLSRDIGDLHDELQNYHRNINGMGGGNNNAGGGGGGWGGGGGGPGGMGGGGNTAGGGGGGWGGGGGDGGHHHNDYGCGVPASWRAAAHLGLFGGAAWFGLALWILIWLITTRTAASISARQRQLITSSSATKELHTNV